MEFDDGGQERFYYLGDINNLPENCKENFLNDLENKLKNLNFFNDHNFFDENKFKKYIEEVLNIEKDFDIYIFKNDKEEYIEKIYEIYFSSIGLKRLELYLFLEDLAKEDFYKKYNIEQIIKELIGYKKADLFDIIKYEKEKFSKYDLKDLELELLFKYKEKKEKSVLIQKNNVSKLVMAILLIFNSFYSNSNKKLIKDERIIPRISRRVQNGRKI